MEYGMHYLHGALIESETANALPTYGTAFSLGPVMELSDSPETSETEGYGDGAVQSVVNRFVRCPVALGSTEFGHEAASKMFGATLKEGTGDLHFNVNDKPPYMGLAGYHDYNSVDKGDKFRGVFFPKYKAKITGKTYTTTTNSITLSGERAEGTAISCKNGDWRIYSDLLDTEEEAKAWVDKMLGGA